MPEDLFTVVHDPMLTDTAKYAESAAGDDLSSSIYRSHGTYYIQFAPAAVTPQARWSNMRLAGAAPRLTDEIFG